jgi:hypothetical protein
LVSGQLGITGTSRLERDLHEIAKISPRIAECVCGLAKRKKIKPTLVWQKLLGPIQVPD